MRAKASRARKMLEATRPKPRKPVPRIIHLEKITDDDIEIIGANTRKRKRLKSPNPTTVTCNFNTSSMHKPCISPPKKRLKTTATKPTKGVYSIFKPQAKRLNHNQHIDHHKTSDPLLSVLQTRFGFNKFRSSQRNAIQSILNGKDVVILMPTGGGKSLCFQLPALMLKKLVIVISPLIALMKNHVDSLKRKGITAKILNSTVSQAEKKKTYDNLQLYASTNENDLKQKKKYKRIEILYTTPEQFTKNQNFSNLMRNMYNSKKIGMFAIDECHCISSWGHDFRPSYRDLTGLRYQYPNVPIMALTATATTQVRNDIIQNLRLNNPQVIMSSFDRPNLFFEFRYIEDVKAVKPWIKPKKSGKKGRKRSRKIDKKEITKINQKICDDIYIFIKKCRYQHQCGLIYVFSRKDTETIAHYLKTEYKLSCEAYHAGMGNKKKVEIQDRWQNNKTNIIVATCAFGMGIDQNNVRFVIHSMINKCLEAYYQEIGRAGRDHKASHILTYYSQNMLNKHRGIALKESMFKISRYKKRGKSKEEIKRMAQNDVRYKQIVSNLKYVQQFAEPTRCRRVILMKYFNEDLKNKQHKSCCDYCENPNNIKRVRMQYEKKRGVKQVADDYGDQNTEAIEEFSPQNWDSNHSNNNSNNYNSNHNTEQIGDFSQNWDSNQNNYNDNNYTNNTNESQYEPYEVKVEESNDGSGIVMSASSTKNIDGLTIATREDALFKFLSAIEENIKGRNDVTDDVFNLSQQQEEALLLKSNTGFIYGLNLRNEIERIKKCTQQGVLWNDAPHKPLENEIVHETDTKNTNSASCRDTVSLNEEINNINMNVNDMKSEEIKCEEVNNNSEGSGVFELVNAMQTERDYMLDMLERKDYIEGFERWKKALNDTYTPKVNELCVKYKADLLRMETENNTQYTTDIDKERELLLSLVLNYNPKRRSQIIWNSDYEIFKETEAKCSDLIDKRMQMINNMKQTKGSINNNHSNTDTVHITENNYGCPIKEEEDEDEDDDLEILSLNKNNSNVQLLIAMGFASTKIDRAWCKLRNNRDTMHINSDHPSFIDAMLDKLDNM